VRGYNNELKEKGIDVSLALDAFKKAVAKAFDVFVLVAGDGDYLPLVRELQTMNMDVMLISWDFESTNGDVTMTSQDLLEEVKYPIQMAIVVDDRLNLKNPLITGLFEPRQFEAFVPEGSQGPLDISPVSGSRRQTAVAAMQTAAPSSLVYADAPMPVPFSAASMPSSYQPAPFPGNFPFQTFSPSQTPFPSRRKALTEAEMAQERISTILSLDGSGGWIRDVEYNNFYFFYTDIVNSKPEELTPGMTLQFRLKFDKIKTEQKDNGDPSYRAIGPIYVVQD
jgi:hypothetical protein